MLSTNCRPKWQRINWNNSGGPGRKMNGAVESRAYAVHWNTKIKHTSGLPTTRQLI